MGYYIDILKDGTILPANGKAQVLIDKCGAKRIPMPEKFEEGIVCVVKNSFFEAAGYAYDERELDIFKMFDGRPKDWLIVPDAAILSNYKK